MTNKFKIYVPPIKIQGKKTKLLPFILGAIPNLCDKTWIEPFMGSGVVGFNAKPVKAIFSDSNPHIINFYNELKVGKYNHISIKQFLQKEGRELSKYGEKHYLAVRERFNEEHNPLDFLFLNRSCFNGMIRFNKKMGFNVPYGHKPERFSQAYVTKITNQVKQVEYFIQNFDWNFVCQDFRDTLNNVSYDNFIYCDPPYIGRHVDYFDSWDETDEMDLFNILNSNEADFLLSTWHSNKYRSNTYIDILWSKFNIITTEHFYHLGAKEENRNSILEALIYNYTIENKNLSELSQNVFEQEMLFV